MAKIPTTEMCPTCAKDTSLAELARGGRRQVRVFQDLDTGKLECEQGHEVQLEPADTQPAQNDGYQDLKRAPAPAAVASAKQPAQTAVAVAEREQVQIAAGSGRILQDGRLEVTLVVPEQYVGPLTSYCDGINKTVEEYLNEVISNAFDNGWVI